MNKVLSSTKSLFDIYIYIYIYIIISIFIFCGGVLSASDAFAESETLDLNFDIAPSLKITLPSDEIRLEAAPSGSAASFVEDDFTVFVATNDPTGYTLAMAAESTDLTRTAAYSDGGNISTPTIQTLAPLTGGYEASDFTANRWGYRIGSGNYLSFAAENTIKTTTETTIVDSTIVSFAAKVDMSTPAGSYANTLEFVAVANYAEEFRAMQGYTLSRCAQEADDAPMTLIDTRDGNDYTVRYIDGKCWMTQNLRIAPGTELTPEDSNVATSWTVPPESTALFNGGDDNSLVLPGVHIPTAAELSTINDTLGSVSFSISTIKEMGGNYNYCAATAGTVCYITDENDDAEAEYSICPSRWHLPTKTDAQDAFSGNQTATEAGTNNASKFLLSRTGYFNTTDNIVRYTGVANGYIWLATAGKVLDGKRRRYYVIDYRTDNVYHVLDDAYRASGLPVRCVLTR